MRAGLELEQQVRADRRGPEQGDHDQDRRHEPLPDVRRRAPPWPPTRAGQQRAEQAEEDQRLDHAEQQRERVARARAAARAAHHDGVAEEAAPRDRSRRAASSWRSRPGSAVRVLMLRPSWRLGVPRSSRRRGGSAALAQAAAGEGEEHVVERRAVHLAAATRDAARRRPPRSSSGSARGPSSTRTSTRGAVARSPRGRRAAARPAGAGSGTCARSAAVDARSVAGQLGLQRLGGVVGDDLAVVDDDHPLGHRVGLVEVVRGEHDRSCRARRASAGCAPTGSPGSAGRGRSTARRGTAAAARAPGPSRRRAGGAGRRTGPTTLRSARSVRSSASSSSSARCRAARRSRP